jgi:hypothetical protein
MNIPDSTFYSGILLASVFDLKIIRYQPWKRTAFTDISQGYPTISCVRLCCYSDITGNMIQIIGSIIILITKEGVDDQFQDILLLTFSCIDTIYSIFKVSMLMIGFDELRKVEKDVLIMMKHIQDQQEKIDELHIIPHNSVNIDQTNTLYDDSSSSQETDRVVLIIREFIMLTIIHQLSNSIAEESIVEMTPYSSENQISILKPVHPHADETLEMLRQQVRDFGAVPVQYITLDEIRKELNILFQQCNEGKLYNEERLDYLLRCLALNPQYRKEQEEEAKRWREESREFIEQSLATMRGFIPPFIFTITEQSLVEDYGMKKALVRRIFTKKCLWLVRMHPEAIAKLHEAELIGRFNPIAQNLDIVELAAVYAALPTTFHKDPMGQKMKWKLSIEEKLKEMVIANQAKKLSKQKVRSDCYNYQLPIFSDRHSLHVMNSVNSFNPKPRISLENIGRLVKNPMFDSLSTIFGFENSDTSSSSDNK